MIINGNVPVGVINELYYRLLDYGVEVEDFIVDAESGYVEIITSNNLTAEEADILLFDEEIWSYAKSYITDIVDEGILDKARGYLQNERGFMSVGGVSTAITIGGMALLGGSGGGEAVTEVVNTVASNPSTLETIGSLAIGIPVAVFGIFILFHMVKDLVGEVRDMREQNRKSPYHDESY